MKRKKAATLGSVLRACRVKAGLSQVEASSRAGIDRSYLSEIECDLKSPTVNRLQKVCDALGVRVSDVMRAVEDGTSP